MPPSFLCRAVWCMVLATSASAQTAAPLPASIPSQIPGQNAILMGAAWYPEQWPESRWEEDLRMMEAADLKVVRIAEFAWSRMESSEGHYDFDWLEPVSYTHLVGCPWRDIFSSACRQIASPGRRN